MAKKEPEKVASLLFDDMAEGGGLLDNIRAKVIKAEYVLTDFNGRSSMSRPAAHIVLEEPDGTVHDDQWWTCGKIDEWTPSEDGRFLVPIGLKEQISKKSNLGMLMGSFMEQGAPKEKVRESGGAIDFLMNLDAHWSQVPTGRGKKKDKDGNETQFEDTCLCIREVFAWPWEKKSPSNAKKTASSVKKSAAKKTDAKKETSDDDSTADCLTAFIESQIEEKGEVSRGEIPTLLMQVNKDTEQWDVPTVQAMISLAFDPGWLEDDDRSWVCEDSICKAAE